MADSSTGDLALSVLRALGISNVPAPIITDKSITTIVGSQLLVGGDIDVSEVVITNPSDTPMAISAIPLTSVNGLGAMPIAAGATIRLQGFRSDIFLYSPAAGKSITTLVSRRSPLFNQYSQRCIAASHRVGTPTQLVSGIKTITSRNVIFFRPDGDVSDLQFVFQNWYWDNSYNEAVVGNDITVTASIEYPAGVFNRIKFGGKVSRLMPGGVAITLVSDTLPITGKAGDKAVLWTCQDLPAAGNNFVVSLIEGSTAFDQNVNSDATDAGGAAGNWNYAYAPIVLGTCAAPNPKSYVIAGDSISRGQADNVPSATRGAYGWPARAMDNAGQTYVKLAKSGMGSNTFINGVFVRDLISKLRFSHILTQIGTNDLQGGGTAQAVINMVGRVAQVFGSAKPVFATFVPRNTSTDGYTTIANQTMTPAKFQQFNDLLRSFNVPVLDAADAASSGRNSGIWRIDQGAMTNDGTHPNSVGAAVIASDTYLQNKLKAIA